MEESLLLGYDIMSLSKQFLMFQRYLVPSSSRVERSKNNAPRWEVLTA